MHHLPVLAGAEHQNKIGEQAQTFHKTFRDEVSQVPRDSAVLHRAPQSAVISLLPICSPV